MIKIINDLKNMELNNDLFTQALIEIENHEYENATAFLEAVLRNNDNIEQRAGALFLMTLANAKDDKLSDTMLKVIYNN